MYNDNKELKGDATMDKPIYKLKRKERFNNQVLLDLSYLLIDQCHVHVMKVGLTNHEQNLSLNSKIDKILDSEYTLDYLKEKQPHIKSITLAQPNSDNWIKIRRNGKILTNQRQLFKRFKPIVKGYFKG